MPAGCAGMQAHRGSSERAVHRHMDAAHRTKIATRATAPEQTGSPDDAVLAARGAALAVAQAARAPASGLRFGSDLRGDPASSRSPAFPARTAPPTQSLFLHPKMSSSAHERFFLAASPSGLIRS